MSVPAGGPSRKTRANVGVVAQVRPTLAEINRQSVSLATIVDSCVNCGTPAPSRRSVALTIGVTDAAVWSSTRTQNATDSVDPFVIRPVSVRAMPWLGSVRPQWLTLRPLALLGRHSLAVFALHVILVYALSALPRVDRLAEAALTAGVFAALFGLAWMLDSSPRRSAGAAA